MDKAQALHAFWSGFDVAAYDASTVPEDADYPRLTYDAVFDTLDNVVTLTASIWYRSYKWEAISQKVEEIERGLKDGGVTIPYDEGLLWIQAGSPFAQRMTDPDPMIRRVFITVMGEYLSDY